MRMFRDMFLMWYILNGVLDFYLLYQYEQHTIGSWKLNISMRSW